MSLWTRYEPNIDDNRYYLCRWRCHEEGWTGAAGIGLTLARTHLKELITITHKERINPAIDAHYFPNTPNQQFWSSSPYANNNSNAFVVNFTNGGDFNQSRSTSYRVHLVSGSYESTSSVGVTTATGQTHKAYIPNTVPDTHINQYLRCLQRLAFAECGRTAFHRYTPSINAAIFPNTVADFFWPSSPFANNGYYAWVVDFGDGYDSRGSRGSSYRVRLVRSSQ